MNILLITNAPTPYRIPLFNKLNDELLQLGHKLRVVFAASGYERRKWLIKQEEFKFDFTFLNTGRIVFKNLEKILFTYGGLYGEIRKFKPDKVITNGFSIATLKLFLYSFFKTTEIIIWTGTVLPTNKKESYWRKKYRSLLCSRTSHFISYSSLTKDYLMKLGVSQEKISIAINTVDTDFFRNETEKLRNQTVRDDQLNLTYIGYLSPRKNVAVLINIFAEILKLRNNIILNIIGDGSEKNNLSTIADKLDINNNVLFHGYVQKEDIPKYLSVTDIFLFQTDFDIWGLVLNEAMAAGLPCISSKNASSSIDLIQDGINGFIVDFKDLEDVKKIIIDLLDSNELRKRVGKNAQDFIINNAGLNNSVNGFLEALIHKNKKIVQN